MASGLWHVLLCSEAQELLCRVYVSPDLGCCFHVFFTFEANFGSQERPTSWAHFRLVEFSFCKWHDLGKLLLIYLILPIDLTRPRQIPGPIMIMLDEAAEASVSVSLWSSSRLPTLNSNRNHQKTILATSAPASAPRVQWHAVERWRAQLLDAILQGGLLIMQPYWDGQTLSIFVVFDNLIQYYDSICKYIQMYSMLLKPSLSGVLLCSLRHNRCCSSTGLSFFLLRDEQISMMCLLDPHAFTRKYIDIYIMYTCIYIYLFCWQVWFAFINFLGDELYHPLDFFSNKMRTRHPKLDIDWTSQCLFCQAVLVLAGENLNKSQ